MTAESLPFLFYFMKYHNSKIIKSIFIVFIIIAIRVVMLTQSRTGFMGVIFFIFFVWLFSNKKILSLFLIIFASIIIWNFAPQETKDRFLTFRNTSAVISGDMGMEEAGSMAARWTLTKNAFIVFTENPMIGVGLDNFKVVSLRRWNRWIPPHNTYVQALAEMGIIGLTAFLWVLILTFKNLKESRKLLTSLDEENRFLDHMISAIQVCLLIRIVVSTFGIELYDNYWWLTGGLSVVILRIVKLKYGNAM
jgi:O-antigen ligase